MIKNKIAKKYVLLSISIALVLFLWLALFKDSDSRTVNTKIPMPNMMVQDVVNPGKRFKFAHIHDGPYILHFWASWCHTCKKEHGDWAKIAHHAKIPVSSVAFFDNPNDTLDFLRAHGNPYNYSLNDAEGHISVAMGVRGVPELYVIDKNKRIRYRHTGPITYEQYLRDIAPIIARL